MFARTIGERSWAVRTNADKRRAVELLLRDEEWSKKSDRWIAEKCGVSHNFVNSVRPQLSSDDSSRTGQDGKTRKLPERKSKAEEQAPAPVSTRGSSLTSGFT
jgi:hypothetical protein